MNETVQRAMDLRDDRKYMEEPEYLYNKELKLSVRELARSDAAKIVETFTEHALETAKQVVRLSKSKDENVATKNSHYIIDHLIGRPTQKMVGQVTHINIDVLAD